MLGAAMLAFPARRAWSAALPLRIAIVSRTVFFVPAWLAERKGFFRDEGLAPEIRVYDNAEAINRDLASGAAQVAISTPESVILDAYGGGPLRIVAGNAERLPHFIITKPAIKTPAQLRGARIGVLSLNEGTTFLVRRLADSIGLKPGEYEVLPVGGAPTRWQLLREGKIDAGLQPFPLSYEAEAAGFNNLGPILDYVPDYLFTSVNTDSRWAAANAATLAKVLRALRRGQDAMRSDPAQSVRVAAEELRTSPDFAKRALADTERLRILSRDLSVNARALRGTFDTLVAVGQLKDAVFDSSKVVDARFLTLSRA
jgi:ABC-type nitrate/sulfonate/bicarbonate transport system substrate-binding protein